MRRNIFYILAGLIALLMPAMAMALSVDTPLASTRDEARAKVLFNDIRCVVCQGEAIADSPADVARDMRQNIREQISAGKSNAEIKATLVASYGDFILMKPPLKTGTLLLWFGPLLILFAAVFFIVRFFRSQRIS